jgi:O-antigen ligase
MYTILPSVQSDLATFGGWCFLAGVFLMVSGDGLTNFSEPSPAHAWPWLYLIPLAVSLPLLVVTGRVRLRRPARAAILYRPLSALLVAFALSTIFSSERALSLVALGSLAGIAVFWWYATRTFEDEWLAEATWIVVGFAALQLAADVIAARLAEGINQIPTEIRTTAWLGKHQVTWVLNLLAPFLLARFIGDRRPWMSWVNGVAWIATGIANYLMLARMGTIVFVLTTLAVCLLNLRYWRRWLWMMGAAAVAGTVMVVNNLRISTFVVSTIFDRSQNQGIDLRLTIWGEAWRMFLAHPIFGIGVGTFDEVAYQMPGNTATRDFRMAGWHAHNVPMHILTEAGVLGLAAWVFLWYIVLTTLVRAWRSDDEQRRLFSSAALVSVVAFQVLSMTEVMIAARVIATVRMNLMLGLLVVGGLRYALPATENTKG